MTCRYKSLVLLALAPVLMFLAEPVCGQPVGAAAQCTADIDCDDGRFCNGGESCLSGQCVDAAPACGLQACDESLDLCVDGYAPSLEAGVVTTDDQGTLVLLGHSYERPVIVASAHFENLGEPATTRVYDVTRSSFRVRLQTPDGSPIGPRKVSYLAVEEGAWTVEGLKIEAYRKRLGTIDQRNDVTGRPLSFTHNFQRPVVLGQLMTNEQDRFGYFWTGGAVASDVPNPSGGLIGRIGTRVQRGNNIDEEMVGYIVLEAGRGELFGIDLEAGLTGPLATGATDGGSDLVFRRPFDTAPEITLVTLAGLDVPDPGWAQPQASPSLQGSNQPAPADRIGVSVEKRPSINGSRSSAPRPVSYFVIERPFSYRSSTPPKAVGGPSCLTENSGSLWCALDPDQTQLVCDGACATVNQAITSCDAASSQCLFSSSSSSSASCLSCLAKNSLTPVSAAVCAARCGLAVKEVIEVRSCLDDAKRDFKDAVFTSTCNACIGPPCPDPYEVRLAAPGLRCNEGALALTRCEETSPSPEIALLSSGGSHHGNLCVGEENWSSTLSEQGVFDIRTGRKKRDCLVSRVSGGPPGVGADVSAQFDCSCSGAGCGDSAAVPVFADVSAISPGIAVNVRTQVFDACDRTLKDEQSQNVSRSSSPVPLSVTALPGDKVFLFVEGTSTSTSCFNALGETEVTESGGVVAMIQCSDSVNVVGMLTGVLTTREAEGVSVQAQIGGTTRTFTFGSLGTLSLGAGVVGDSYNIQVLNPRVMSFQGQKQRLNTCSVVGGTGILPTNQNPYQAAVIECVYEEIFEPLPVPKDPTPPVDFWRDPGWGGGGGASEGCQFLCPPAGTLPQTECPADVNFDPNGECINVLETDCRISCPWMSNALPELSVVVASPYATAGTLVADDHLEVYASAEDPDGLLGFLMEIDGQNVAVHGSAGAPEDNTGLLQIDTSGLSSGPHELWVWAVDENTQGTVPIGARVDFEVDHSIADPCQSDTAVPTVTLDGLPANGEVTPGVITLFGNAQDADGPLKHVRFRVGGQVVRTDTTYPYTYTWHASPGEYILSAEAVDRCNKSRSDEVTVTVTDPCDQLPPPTVTMTSHQDGEWLEPARMTFTATAGAAAGLSVDRVEIQVAQFAPESLLTAPWTTKGYFMTTQGEQAIRASAWDSCGRRVDQEITIHVSENASVCQLDVRPPYANIWSPTDAFAIYAGPWQMGTDKNDDIGLLAGALWENGSPIPGSTVLSGDPGMYEWTWDATVGRRLLQLRLMDVCGKTGSSQAVEVEVIPSPF